MTSPSIVTISYHDLVKFSREPEVCEQNEDKEARHRLMEEIGRAYGGNDSLGILSVKDVPGLPELRQRLLPMAAQIPALPAEDLSRCVVKEACYAVGWSHGKEELTPGVPDLSKGSFYANPLVNDLSQAMLERHKQQQEQDQTKASNSVTYEANLKRLGAENPSFFAPNVFPASMPDLEGAIFDMGQLIAKVGRLIARVCQAYCEQQNVKVELEQILCDSLNCKARLLHYFNNNDSTAVPEPPTSPLDEKKDETVAPKADEWACGWHNDHGSLTGLVPALYLSDNSDGTKQQLDKSPDPKAGLYIQSRSGNLVKATLPSDCLGFQIGETFQILSGGLLQATPHAVKQQQQALTNAASSSSSANGGSVTRETYAVFLEPEYEFPMSIPEGRSVDDCCPPNRANEILQLNSIQSRWKPGMTFGEFNDATLKAFHKDA